MPIFSVASYHARLLVTVLLGGVELRSYSCSAEASNGAHEEKQSKPDPKKFSRICSDTHLGQLLLRALHGAFTHKRSLSCLGFSSGVPALRTKPTLASKELNWMCSLSNIPFCYDLDYVPEMESCRSAAVGIRTISKLQLDASLAHG